MKTKNFLLFALMACFVSEAKAQFSSSENVYYYEYQYSIQNGIKSQLSYIYEILVFNFQNNMLGWTATNKKEVIKYMTNDNNYFDNMARNDLGNRYNKYNTQPTVMLPYPPSIFMYNSQNSTSSKYTYQLNSRIYGHNYGQLCWTGSQWGNRCFSFSLDRKELIDWSTSDDTRHYYKLVNKNSLKRNLDFLN